VWARLRWTVGPHYPISNSCKGWTIRKQLKTHADGLLVPADSSVDYVPASIFLRLSIRS
jgi:hypothetical protein